MTSKTKTNSHTPDRILDVAERLVQSFGFNAFSYADIADEVRVRKASLHYHFPTKGRLGEELISRYEKRFLEALAKIESRASSPSEKLALYMDIYAGVLRKNRMCLCGMLAAEYSSLPNSMREGVSRFFASNEGWLSGLLAEGRKSKAFSFSGSSIDSARFIVSSLEGAMLVARAQKDFERFEAVCIKLLADFTCRT